MIMASAVSSCQKMSGPVSLRLITQHISDRSFRFVRYCGWYSNKMRGQRDNRVNEDDETAAGKTVEVINVSDHKPRRIPRQGGAS